MTRGAAPTLPGRLATTVPLAAAILVRHSWGWQWVVPRCPHCGRKHTHGGGGRHDDPRQFLGGRVAHCGAGEWREYYLVDAGDAPVQARRRARSEVPR